VASTRYPMRPVAWFHVVADSEITTLNTVKRCASVGVHAEPDSGK
jgi:hypothetical protein